MFKLSVVYLLAVYINLTYGHGRFRLEIPNGYDVPHPCGGSVKWEAVGHMEPQYAPKKNAFGEVSCHCFICYTAVHCIVFVSGNDI